MKTFIFLLIIQNPKITGFDLNAPVVGRPGQSNGPEQRFPVIKEDDIQTDHWILSFHWPQTTCEIINENKRTEVGFQRARKVRAPSINNQFENPTKNCFCDSSEQDFSDWKIHGYWPAKLNGIGCATFDTLPVDQLKYIQHDLLEKWPNLRNAEKSGKRCFHNGAELFWAQNWCEHGSVTKKFKNPADYFTEAVDVANKWDLKTILKRGQIIPHVANTYTFTQIEDALQAGGRYQKDKFFSIHCS